MIFWESLSLFFRGGKFVFKKAMMIIAITFAFAVGGIYFYFNSLTYKSVNVIEGELSFKGDKKEEKVKAVVKIDKATAVKYEVQGLTFYFNGKNIQLNEKIYEQNQRYYINLDDFLKASELNYEIVDGLYKAGENTLDLKNKTFIVNNQSFELSGEVLEGLDKYISINDLEHFLNLRDSWNHEEGKIYLFNEKKDLKLSHRDINKSGKAAMMRIEDFAPGGQYIEEETIDKYKIIADYLYSKNFKFNVAWISRYKNPDKGIDNNLLEDRSIENVHYINLMDHLIFRGGTIGLHGYTHQWANEQSAVGSDLSSKANNTVEDTEKIITSAIKTAETLNIPIDFFESAHYHSTMKQQRVIEKYFDIIYEPFKYSLSFNPLISPKDKSTLYLPTNLGYVKDDTGEELANKIRKNANGKNISSFYFHPFKEFKYLKIEKVDENGYVDYSYDENSVLHNIVNALEETGQVTLSARDFR